MRSFLGLGEHSLGSLVILPALGGACLSAIGVAALLIAPVSPLAAGLAEADLGRGLADDAAAAYVRLARASTEPEVRIHALEQAARVHELERNDREEARRLLQLRLSLGGTPAELAAVREELAESHLADRQVVEASQQFVAAHDADPEGERAPELLARAAELRVVSEEPGKARALWGRVIQLHPSHASRANLGLGSLALAQNRPAMALSPFQAASRSPDPDIAKAARLGLAACYERLGELDGALAELDQSSLPIDVRERRKAGLRDRASVKGGAEAP